MPESVLQSGLPTSGIYRKLCRDILHESKGEHCLDIPKFYIYQWSHHIIYYVNHNQDKNYIMGKLVFLSYNIAREISKYVYPT